MKKLIILSILLILALTGFSQFDELIMSFNLSELSGITTKRYMVGRTTTMGSFGPQIVFDSVCSTVTLDAGMSLRDNAPAYPASFGGWDMPVTLDTTATRTDGKLKFAPYVYGGDRPWNIMLKEYEWCWLYFWVTVDSDGCSTGKIEVYY